MLSLFIISCIVIPFIVLLLFIKHHYTYWSRLGIQQPSVLDFLRDSLIVSFQKKNFGLVYDDIYRKYSGVEAVGFYQFHIPKLMLKSPELIQKVLISDFDSFRDNESYAPLDLNPFMELEAFLARGEQWRLARGAIVYGFSSKKLKDLYHLLNQSNSLLNQYIEDHLTLEIEAKELASLFNMTNVSNSIFGIDSNCYANSTCTFRKMVEVLHKESWQCWWKVMIIFFFPKIRDFLRISFLPKEVTTYVATAVRQIAETKIINGTKGNDFFQHYMDRGNPAEENIHDITSLGMTFFMAGMESISLPCGNALYELALNVHIQEKLHQELQAAYGGKTELRYETLLSLPYLDQVFKETLRKYPVVYSLSKVCTKSTTLEIDGKFFSLEPGTHVMVPVFSLHRDGLYHPDPERFNPERFNEEGRAAQTNHCYLPFGDGPRACPGKRFGEIQIKLFLSSIIHRYRVLPTKRTPKTLEFLPGAFLVAPSSKEWVHFEKRI